MTPVTGTLIIVNVAVFLLPAHFERALLANFALWPLGSFHVRGFPGVVGFRPWQLVTSAFLHAGLSHLFLNMFALRIFGRDVERALGSRRFLVLYGAAVVSSACVQLLVVSIGTTRPYPTVGASGGVFGVLLAFGVLYPRRIVRLLLPPVSMPAWLFVTLYGVLELGSGVVGTQSGVAHFAHLGGMLGGWLALPRRRRAEPGAAGIE